MKYYERDKREKDYENLRLCYEVKDSQLHKKQNEENFDTVKKLLEEVGVWLDIKDGKMYISIFASQFLRAKNRYAGRRDKICSYHDKNGKIKFYRYSDIVFMLQTMTDKEIAEKIDMKIATYYRHKKKLKESEYFKSLDLNKLQDKNYLESQEKNFSF